jgi:phage major head subunit gpT-like protein
MALDTAKATATLRDITRTFDRSVQQTTPFYPEVCTIVPSTGLDEKYAWLGDIPSVREWLGDRVFNEMRASTYVLANKLWEDSIKIKKTGSGRRSPRDL